jgi:hypothetical protein
MHGALLSEERLRTASEMCVFCARNGLVTPEKHGLARQSQVALLERLSVEDVVVFRRSESIKFEPLLKSFSQG